METFRKYLEYLLQYSELAESIAKTLDANETGIDDDFAKFIDLDLQPKIKIILNSLPPKSQAAQGYAATLAFCNSILSQIDLIIASAIPKDEKVSKVKSLVADLFDANKVYPARSGKDADILKHTREKAQERLARLENS